MNNYNEELLARFPVGVEMERIRQGELRLYVPAMVLQLGLAYADLATSGYGVIEPEVFQWMDGQLLTPADQSVASHTVFAQLFQPNNFPSRVLPLVKPPLEIPTSWGEIVIQGLELGSVTPSYAPRGDRQTSWSVPQRVDPFLVGRADSTLERGGISAYRRLIDSFMQVVDEGRGVRGKVENRIERVNMTNLLGGAQIALEQMVLKVAQVADTINIPMNLSRVLLLPWVTEAMGDYVSACQIGASWSGWELPELER